MYTHPKSACQLAALAAGPATHNLNSSIVRMFQVCKRSWRLEKESSSQLLAQGLHVDDQTGTGDLHDCQNQEYLMTCQGAVEQSLP